MFIAADAIITSVVVKTVVTVNLVTENFPLDTPITKWARTVPAASYIIFQYLSRILTMPKFRLGSVSNSAALFSGITLASSTRRLLRIVIRTPNYFYC